MSGGMLRVYPSARGVGLVIPQVQQVPFEKYIGAKTNIGKLEDISHYLATIMNIDSETTIGQQWGSNKTKQNYTIGQLSASYYSIQAYVEYNIEEQARFESVSNGVSLPNFLENLAKQGINQRRHQLILFGADSDTSLNQGILANATVETLPSDSNGASTLTGYNPAELQRFLANIAINVMDSTYGMAKPCVIASSQRVISYLRTMVVSLTESQKEGAGVDSVAGLYNRIVGQWLGVGNIEFIADDLLKGDTKDKIVFVAPGIDKQPQGDDGLNLAGALNGVTYNTYYDASIGLIDEPAPVALGVFSKKYVFKMTPGITIHPKAVSYCEVAYA